MPHNLFIVTPQPDSTAHLVEIDVVYLSSAQRLELPIVVYIHDSPRLGHLCTCV